MSLIARAFTKVGFQKNDSFIVCLSVQAPSTLVGGAGVRYAASKKTGKWAVLLAPNLH